MSIKLKQRAHRILSLLDQNYVLHEQEFLTNYNSPFQMLVAIVLSAQSTDKQVNSVTKTLFKKFPYPSSFASLSIEEIERLIAKVGLYRNKAKSIHALSHKLIAEYDSEVPTSLDELIKLPGVGRKTANVILNDLFNIHEGIAIDTHVKRISFRLGLTQHINVEKIELDLMVLIPPKRWGDINRLLITHGRNICSARFPKCDICFLSEICNRNGVDKNK